MTNTSADAVATHGGHVPELDGLRGIAVLGVLLAHAVVFLEVVPSQGPGKTWGHALATMLVPGWGGVDLFFTLSGFLITGILLRSRSQPTYFPSFYMRRVLRIFPLYYGFLIGTLLLARFSPFVAAIIPQTLREVLPYFFYVQNWPLFWSGWTGLTSIWGLFWSLAVEEQFYLVWPALVRFLTPKKLLLVCIVGVCIGAPQRMHLLHRHGLAIGIMQWPFSRLDGLFLGSALAIYAFLKGRPLPILWAKLAALLGVAILMWVAAFHTEELASGNGAHIWVFGVLAFALISASIILAVQHKAVWTQRLLTFPPLVTAGRISYGMYVYHLMVYAVLNRFAHLVLRPRFGPDFSLPFVLAYIALSIAATMLVSMLSFRFFETPFLKLKRFFPSQNPVAISARARSQHSA